MLDFRLHFSVIRMGSRGTFVLCTDVEDQCCKVASWRVSSVHLFYFSREQVKL